jgi:hypothetical protein
MLWKIVGVGREVLREMMRRELREIRYTYAQLDLFGHEPAYYGW